MVLSIYIGIRPKGACFDGFGTVQEYAEYSKSVNQSYLCISDHGMLSAIPQQIKYADENNLFPIFACELYVNRHQPTIGTPEEYSKYLENLSEEEKNKLKKSYHLLAIAYNDIGYSNLVQLCSWSHIYGKGGNPKRPRVTHEQLKKHKEGIIFTSCCYIGEVGQAFDQFGKDAAYDVLNEYIAMFGKENFVLEIMLLDFKKQKPYDAFIVEAHDKLGLKIILSQDCHYCQKEHSKYQRMMLMTRTKNTIKGIEKAIQDGSDTDQFFELQDQNLWMKSEDELNEKWWSDYRDIVPYEVFCQSKRETIIICEKAKGVQLDKTLKLPKIPYGKEKLYEELMKGWKWRDIGSFPNKQKYKDQLKWEYELICRKEFESYFLIQKEMVDEAKDYCKKTLGWGDGTEAMGVGRGSAGAFLTCYLLGITNFDPIYHDLLPERFLSDARGGKQIRLRFTCNPIKNNTSENI